MGVGGPSIRGFNPLQRIIGRVPPFKLCTVAGLKPQSDWHILAFAGQPRQLILQLRQQTASLTTVLFRFESGFVGLAAAFVYLLGHAGKRRLDTRIDTVFPLAQAGVLRLQ
ncbi:hypothetical protein D9M71_414830 [compost metagenome]